MIFFSFVFQLVDLRKPPIDVNAAIAGAGGNAMGGILGAALGESAAQTEARVAEAKKGATDLSGLVRKKNRDAPAPAAAVAETNSNGKRPAEEPAGGAAAEGESKKARVDEAEE